MYNELFADEMLMLDKYLQESTYDYKIHATFENYGNLHAVVTENDPGGGDSDYYILFIGKGGNQIFNSNGDLCANIVNGEIQIIEG